MLKPSIDLAEVRRRAATRPSGTTIAELLLDQSVVSGIGNIYRCEALFVRGIDPWTPHAALTADALDALVLTASRQMAAGISRNPQVYGRAGRPCRRCRTPIEVRRVGEQARNVYWCPRCQVSYSE